MFLGFVIVIIGLIFLLKNLGFIGGDLWPIIWPSLVVVFGLSILLRRKRHKDKCEKFREGMHKFGDEIRKTFSGEDK